jgi:GNAT superfamily N-acetyltransferase
VIRAATEADVAAITDIEARAWRWAYSDFVDPDAMPIADERVERWRAQVATGRVCVFDQDGAVVGYASVDGDQLRSLYVDPAAQGAGVGARLHDDALERVRAGGHALAWLWVFTANAQGRSFYERRGWRAVGEPHREPHWVGDALRYERSL